MHPSAPFQHLTSIVKDLHDDDAERKSDIHITKLATRLEPQASKRNHSHQPLSALFLSCATVGGANELCLLARVI